MGYVNKDWHDHPGSYSGTKQSFTGPLAALLALSSLARTVLSSQSPESQPNELGGLPKLGPATPDQISDYTSRALELHYKSLEQDNGTAESYKRLSEEWMLRAVHAVVESGVEFEKYWALVSTFIERTGGNLNGSAKCLQERLGRTSVKLRALAEKEGNIQARDRLYSSLMGAFGSRMGAC